MAGRKCRHHGAAVSRGCRASAVGLITTVTTRVETVAPHSARHAAAILTLTLVRQAWGVAAGRLVRPVVAVTVAVTEVIHRDTLATVTGVLRGGTKSCAIGLVASIPAVNKSITAAIEWQARGVVTTVKSVTSTFAVVLVRHVVAVEVPVAAALFGDAETVLAAPLVVEALRLVDAMHGVVLKPLAQLVGSRAPSAASPGIVGVLRHHAVRLGLLAVHEAYLARLALVARPPVIGHRWLRSRVRRRLLARRGRWRRGRALGLRVALVAVVVPVLRGRGVRRGRGWRRPGRAEAAFELDLLAALFEAGQVVGQQAAASVVRAALAASRPQPIRVALAVVARAVAPRRPRGPGSVEVGWPMCHHDWRRNSARLDVREVQGSDVDAEVPCGKDSVSLFEHLDERQTDVVRRVRQWLVEHDAAADADAATVTRAEFYNLRHVVVL